ncbi:MAG: hypothetical protein FJY67_06945 [Calditrichaeota bacterium]|nr:hypothetical protein [Calditrichota bacterium]
MRLFCGALATFLAAQMAVAEPQYSPRLPRLPERFPVEAAPRRDAPMRVLALRVEFVPDTLATTTGDGTFALSRSHSLYAAFPPDEDILLDPFPHDSLYFADQLRFAQDYFRRMSNGAVELDWDVYPAGERAAYRLPRQMWQYNWNSGDDQLDRGLAELFRDAVITADRDPALLWANYDLVIVFHAGAGLEFDLGFRLTPHDIPSAWMVREDFRRQLNLPNGIPVDDGARFVSSGLILPETESHDGVQIGMAGVVCLLIGHWLGLPALYDRDDGNPVVGKWSLMDRGFGNFWGCIPGPVDAWSASYKGWLTLNEPSPGGWQIESRFGPFDRSPEDPVVPKAYHIPITATESFVLECRSRTVNGTDTMAVGYDRDGRRMLWYRNDYGISRHPDYPPGEPLRAVTHIDNLEFDTPGAGILIWHLDLGLASLISEGRFNSLKSPKGLDLEEADGAQDLGQNYPFLTPGWGTDYGIFADAWYGDNQYHRDANDGRPVMFGDNTYPDSRSNAGAFTHIAVDSFSRRGEVMGFRFNLDFKQPGFPFLAPKPHFSERRYSYTATGNFDADPDDEIVYFSLTDTIFFLDGDGTIIQRFIDRRNFAEVALSKPSVGDLNGDGMDDVFTYLMRDDGIWQLTGLMSSPNGHQLQVLDETFVDFPDFWGRTLIGGSKTDPKLFSVYDIYVQGNSHNTVFQIFDSNLQSLLSVRYAWGSIKGIFLLGTAESDTVLLIMNYLGTQGSRITEFSSAGELLDREFDNIYFGNPQLVDLDADGWQDIVFSYRGINIIRQVGLRTGEALEIESITSPSLFEEFYSNIIGSLDADGDGRYELLIYDEGSFLTLNINGTMGLKIDSPWKSNGRMNVTGSPQGFGIYKDDIRGTREIFFTGGLRSAESIPQAPASRSLFGFSSRGTKAAGLPVALGESSYWYGDYIYTQLDDDEAIEVVINRSDGVEVIELPGRGLHPWWSQQYRDKQNRNAIWEPARAFVAAPGSPLIPDGQCYNWPNPAVDMTAIRYYLNFPASVKIDIYDIAGDRVKTLYGPGQAGLPNEVVWDVTGVARGGYLAVVEATAGGRSERRVVKIAVKK